MKTKIRMSGNRTVIGIICVILALLITFGVAPLVNRFTEQKVDVVRVKNNIPRGHEITVSDLEIAKVGSYNLPSGVIKDGNSVLGKFATTDLCAGDYLFASKLTANSNRAEDVLLSLDGKKVAISVNIGNFAQGLSNKLENGDIISAIIYDKDMYASYTPAELKYLRVITTTTSEGMDKNEAEAGSKAATVTLLVTPEQAELLAQYNSVTTIHFSLVYRGNAETANRYIQAQDDYLAAHPPVTTPAETEGSADE